MVRIDRRRKLPATTLLYGLASIRGHPRLFLHEGRVPLDQGWPLDDSRRTDVDAQRQAQPGMDQPQDGERADRARPEDHRSRAEACRKKNQQVSVPDEELVGRYSALDMVNVETGEIYVERRRLTTDSIAPASRQGSRKSASSRRSHQYRPYVRNTMAVGQEPLREQALVDIIG